MTALREQLIGAWKLVSYVEKPVDRSNVAALLIARSNLLAWVRIADMPNGANESLISSRGLIPISNHSDWPAWAGPGRAHSHRTPTSRQPAHCAR
jgi:hypothetical protein